MWDIWQGDARALLRGMEEESFQCCVTSPPYWGLRDYKLEPLICGGNTECEHNWSVPTSKKRQSPRRDHDGRDFGPTRGLEPHRIEGAFKVSQGDFCSLCGAWRGSLGLEPTPELYTQHLVEIFREVRRVLRGDGTLFLNLGDSYATNGGHADKGVTARRSEIAAGERPEYALREFRCRPTAGLKPKDLIGIPWRVAFALQADGWYLRSAIIWRKMAPMPSSQKDRPTLSYEHIFLLAKSERYFYDYVAASEPFSDDRRGRDGGKQGRQRNRGGRTDGYTKPSSVDPSANEGRRGRDIWTFDFAYEDKEWKKRHSAKHYASFPLELPHQALSAGSKKGDLVLDPFAGTGTTMLAAERLGRDSIGIELNADYIRAAEARLKEALSK